MVDKLKKIWVDGELVDWDAATVHVLTHSLHYGVAAFEGIRAYKRAGNASGAGAGTHVFRLKEHIQRLVDSCKMRCIPSKFSKEQIERRVRRGSSARMGWKRVTSARSCTSATARWGSTPPTTPSARRSWRGSGGRTWARRRSRRGSVARSARSPDTTSTSASPKGSSPASTRTASSPSARQSWPATTRPSCSTPRATSPRARGRTSSSSSAACS